MNAVDDRDNLTCLHIACLYDMEALADIIIEHDKVHHDVDFNAVSKHSQRMAWMYATDSGFSELAKKVHRAGIGAKKYRNRRKPSAGPRP